MTDVAKLIKEPKSDWRIWVSTPAPPACEAGALPSELIPRLYILVVRLHHTYTGVKRDKYFTCFTNSLLLPLAYCQNVIHNVTDLIIWITTGTPDLHTAWRSQ